MNAAPPPPLRPPSSPRGTKRPPPEDLEHEHTKARKLLASPQRKALFQRVYPTTTPLPEAELFTRSAADAVQDDGLRIRYTEYFSRLATMEEEQAELVRKVADMRAKDEAWQKEERRRQAQQRADERAWKAAQEVEEDRREAQLKRERASIRTEEEAWLRQQWQQLLIEGKIDERVIALFRDEKPTFLHAVQELDNTLFMAFGIRSKFFLLQLPRDFIEAENKEFSEDVEGVLDSLYKSAKDHLFQDFADFKAFYARFRQAFASRTRGINVEPTTARGMSYDKDSKLIEIDAPYHSEFHPEKRLLMRASYWPLLRELMQCSAAVVLGDPGTGKSSLLRVVYGLFVYGWIEALRTASQNDGGWATDETSSRPFDKYKGIFWIMESGQFHYAVRKDGTDGVVQGEGVYGLSNNNQQLWRSREVLLLVDGLVPTPFLSKISNVFVFASPQPSNYQRMMKASNAVRLLLPPWSKEEVVHLLDKNQADVWKRMLPYVNHIRSKASNKSTNSARDKIDAGDGESEDHTVAVAKSALRTWDYDDVTHFRQAVVNASDSSRSDGSISLGAGWSFLKAHILTRYELVGGRIRLLLNPSETFASMKRLVKSAVHAVSIRQLKDERWIDSHRYVPSVVYSIVPSSPHPRDPPTAEFASPAISCYVSDRITRANADSVIQSF